MSVSHLSTEDKEAAAALDGISSGRGKRPRAVVNNDSSTDDSMRLSIEETMTMFNVQLQKLKALALDAETKNSEAKIVSEKAEARARDAESKRSEVKLASDERVRLLSEGIKKLEDRARVADKQMEHMRNEHDKELEKCETNFRNERSFLHEDFTKKNDAAMKAHDAAMKAYKQGADKRVHTAETQAGIKIQAAEHKADTEVARANVDTETARTDLQNARKAIAQLELKVNELNEEIFLLKNKTAVQLFCDRV